MKKFSLSILIVIRILAFSQPDSLHKSSYPKVGLVLSGGGAKGLAHIGVLKVLEEVGIVPDYITGSSMGSIIGGLYAIGYSANNLSQLNSSISWSEYLSNSIPLNKIDMLSKSDYATYPLEFPIVGKKIYLPSGIIESQNFWQLFHQLCWPALHIQSFDSFPIPYRCIATEIVQGQQKTFQNGNLPIAMRSSMAIPGVFSPVIENDSLIYVDGGVCKNFPVDEAIDLGSDIIIGVYVGTVQELDPTKARTIDKILMQTAFFTGLRESREEMEKCRVLIIPDMSGFGAQSFEQGKEIEKRGEIAARQHIEELMALADSIKQFRTFTPRKKIPLRNITISNIEVRGNKNIDYEFIISKSKLHPGDSVSPQKMTEAVDNIFGTLYFDRIAYWFEPQPDGFKLILDVQEKEPKMLKANLHSNNFWGTAATLNYQHNNLLAKSSQFITKLEISKIPRFSVIHSQSWGPKQRMSTAGGLFFESDFIPIYLNTNKIATLLLNHYGLMLSGGFSNNYYALTLGSSFSITSLHTNPTLRIIVPEASFESFHYGRTSLWTSFKKNTLDRNIFPRNGSQMECTFTFGLKPWIRISSHETSQSIDSLKNNLNFLKLALSYQRNFTFFHRLSLMIGTDVRITNSNTPIFESYFIGGNENIARRGDIPFYGIGYREINIPNFFILKTQTRLKLWNELYAMAHYNYLQGTQQIEDIVLDTFKPEFDLSGYGLGIGYKTLIGPINFWITGNTKHKNVWYYFSFGYTF
ncbi:MAG TPA: patatin-like phospholipase family protein [Salinivirgaceae bacterium]|nr:patatin-like phospholipase family protein [Salinivirgaceae bacterium]